jgi:predicted methyltransferase
MAAFSNSPFALSPFAISRRALIAGAASAVLAPAHLAGASAGGLQALIASDHRRAANRARDVWRKPLETIEFFGIAPNSSVVEILPGSAGYWLEILAPYLREAGRYVAAGRDAAAAANYLKDHERLLARLAADPARYGRVQVTKFNAGLHEIAPAGSADFVLVFRSLHNWVERGEAEASLGVIHKALKPGGRFCLSGHRGRSDIPQEKQAGTGYLRQDFAVAVVEKAGFRLVGSSEAKANPKDTKDHPAGVWTLPPSFRLKDQDREKYAAIGESDRFLLKFAKA